MVDAVDRSLGADSADAFTLKRRQRQEVPASTLAQQYTNSHRLYTGASGADQAHNTTQWDMQIDTIEARLAEELHTSG